jgi:hypothetical protein
VRPFLSATLAEIHVWSFFLVPLHDSYLRELTIFFGIGRTRLHLISTLTGLDPWLGLYRIKEKLRFALTEAHVLNDPVVRIALRIRLLIVMIFLGNEEIFHIFLGAVVIRNGLPSIQAWISSLIDWSLPSSTTGRALRRSTPLRVRPKF